MNELPLDPKFLKKTPITPEELDLLEKISGILFRPPEEQGLMKFVPIITLIFSIITLLVVFFKS